MPQDRNALPGYRLVEPFKQGQLANLCGVYAAINAARVLSPELAKDPDIWADAYELLVSRLHTQRRLKYGLVEGLSYEVWKTLQVMLYDELTERLGTPFRIRPLTRRSAESRNLAKGVRNAIDDGAAVLWGLCGPFNHYTVVAGYTQRRWLLHDSLTLKWLRVSSTMIGGAPGKYHWVPTKAAFVLRRLALSS